MIRFYKKHIVCAFVTLIIYLPTHTTAQQRSTDEGPKKSQPSVQKRSIDNKSSSQQKPKETIFYASDDAKDFNGIGDIKLGMSINDLQVRLTDKGISLDDSDNYNKVLNARLESGVSAFNLIPSKQRYRSHPDANFVDNYQSVLITKYSASGFIVPELKLLFKNNLLIKIVGNASIDLWEAFVAKYGKPREEREQKTIVCAYKYTGARFEKTESSTWATWRDDSAIAVKGVLYFYYNDKCELSGGNLFFIEDKIKTEGYDSENRKAKDKFYEAVENESRETLRKRLGGL